jgi:hypothetical protein
MSTFLGTLKNTGSRNVDMSVVRYWGGNAYGACLQLTASTEEGNVGHVQLNASDIVALMPVFKQILDDTFKAKKYEAETAIKENQELLKTIVQDMREVSEMAINQPVFDYAALLTIGKKELTGGDE